MRYASQTFPTICNQTVVILYGVLIGSNMQIGENTRLRLLVVVLCVELSHTCIQNHTILKIIN